MNTDNSHATTREQLADHQSRNSFLQEYKEENEFLMCEEESIKGFKQIFLRKTSLLSDSDVRHHNKQLTGVDAV